MRIFLIIFVLISIFFIEVSTHLKLNFSYLHKIIPQGMLWEKAR
jgi:hypothetical protein